MPIHLRICICTCERPDGLARLLLAIDAQRLTTIATESVGILVVDNGHCQPAAPVVEAYRAHGRFQVTDVREDARGLAAVRNRSLKEAAALGADWIALIDDDEWPAPDWLEAMFETARRSNAAACVGPIHAVFEGVPPVWAARGGFHGKRLPQRDGFVSDAYTANVLLDLKRVTEAGLDFDMRFNTLGGEDTYFFRSLLLAGHRIAWSEGAVVYDGIPARRMSLRWLLARWYRSGSVEAYLGRFRPESARGRIENLARGGLRLGGGLLRLGGGLLAFRRPLAFAGAYTLCRGAGLLAAVFGLGYREYHPSRYR